MTAFDLHAPHTELVVDTDAGPPTKTRSEGLMALSAVEVAAGIQVFVLNSNGAPFTAAAGVPDSPSAKTVPEA